MGNSNWSWIRIFRWRWWRRFTTSHRFWTPLIEKIRTRIIKPLLDLRDDTLHSLPIYHAELWAPWSRNCTHRTPKHNWKSTGANSSRSQLVLGEWTTSSRGLEWCVQTSQSGGVWTASRHTLQYERNKIRKFARWEERLDFGGRWRAHVHGLSYCIPNRRPSNHFALSRYVSSWLRLELASNQKRGLSLLSRYSVVSSVGGGQGGRVLRVRRILRSL